MRDCVRFSQIWSHICLGEKTKQLRPIELIHEKAYLYRYTFFLLLNPVQIDLELRLFEGWLV